MDVLDVLFPKRCVVCRHSGAYICADCFANIRFDDGGICVVCNRPAVDGLTHPGCAGKYTLDGAFASLAFHYVVKKLVYSFKYQPFLSDLQRTMLDFMYEGLIQKEVFIRTLNSETILIPIPLHKDRMNMRGYNQSAILAKGMAEKLGIEWKDILVRTRNTTSQIHLKREERYENLKGAFILKETARSGLKDVHIFLVDDIVTSGATFSEAANVLKRNGAKSVYGIALARGQ